MGYNAIEVNGEVKLDLSEDTISEETMFEGTTAHNKDGEPIEGKVMTLKGSTESGTRTIAVLLTEEDFGNASPSDVTWGVKFSSKEGMCVPGALPVAYGGVTEQVVPQKSYSIGPCVSMSYEFSEPVKIDPAYGGYISLVAPFSDFGNAQTNDVAEGVTFTAAGGFNAVGTRKVSEPILYGTYLLRDIPRITTPSDTLILDLNDSEAYGFYLDGGDIHYGAISSVEFRDDGFIYVNIEDTYIEYDGTRWAYYDPLASEFVNPPDERYKIIDIKTPISVPKDIYDMFMGCVDNDQGQTSFDIGKKAQYDEFWDAVQNFGKRTSYNGVFFQWGDSAFYPKYDLIAIGNASSMFQQIKVKNFKQRLIDCGVTLDLSKATNVNYLFSVAEVTHVPVINTTSASSLASIFYNCRIVDIEKLILKSDGSQTFSDSFKWCESLVNLIIEGTIGKSGLDLRWSTKLSKASLISIINALSRTTSGLSITLSKTAVDAAYPIPEGFTSNGEWAMLIKTRTNWTINLL